MSKMIVSFDVGGTTIKIGVVTKKGEIVKSYSVDTDKWMTLGESSFFVNEVKELQKEYEIAGVGIGFPGLIRKDRTGFIELTNIPNVAADDIVQKIQQECGDLVVGIENDAKCAALGEKYFGDHEKLDDYLFITLGTGVGGGLVLNGEIFLGGRGNASEIGHVLVDGLELEKQIGQRFLVEKGKEIYNDNVERSVKEIAGKALQGEKKAQQVFTYLGEKLGKAIIGYMRLYDVNTFVLGGGISEALELFKDACEGQIKKHISSDYYLNGLSLEKATLGNQAGILGAASLVLSKL